MWLNLSIQSLKENKYKPFVTGGKGAGHNFWKNDIAQGHSIKRLDLDSQSANETTHPKVPRQFQGHMIRNGRRKDTG